MTKLKQSKIDLANKTVNYLQNLNKGYNLVETKKPIVVAGLNFYLDLVLFHEVLNSYLLINFKFTRINKTDIGKMQIYLNSYKNKLANNQATNLIGIIVLLNKKINKKNLKIINLESNFGLNIYNIIKPDLFNLLEELQ
ncbi:PDDEXK nuclease domain-containing protein [Mycoplasmopsis bovirhinis]|uniref:Uncharacterized conserved protein n=1 Tax=Mycoplasmopsis bovirhinis TaxID=29553 RepID=A0A449AF65_9BACT|nr:PDDEXK nuclease domain-containing protein [Mycoplasmopsis bovirhinis]VEU63641.1 Uncharacterized conserved protein [Mycoplasmopsis bovirhinis]